MKEYKDLLEYAFDKNLNNRELEELIRIKNEVEESRSHLDEIQCELFHLIYTTFLKYKFLMHNSSEEDIEQIFIREKNGKTSPGELIKILEEHSIHIEEELKQIKDKYYKISMLEVINKFESLR